MTTIRPAKELLQAYLNTYLISGPFQQACLLTQPYNPALSIEANLQNEVKQVNGYARQTLAWGSTETVNNTLAKKTTSTPVKFTASPSTSYSFFGFAIILRTYSLTWANLPFTQAAIDTSLDIITFTALEISLFTLSTAYKCRFVVDIGATAPTVSGSTILGVDLWFARTSSTVVELYYDQALTSKVNFTAAGSGGFKLQNVDNDPLGCFYNNQVAPVTVNEAGYSLNIETRLGSLPR